MRHTILVLAASTCLAVFAGCANPRCSNRCEPCRGNASGAQQQQAGPGGSVSYPYYTTRGPRDFLETHPQSIGP
ncbi:MAG: hypothetical protein WCJ35_23500 [Planctomycetota bacterium]